MTVYQGGFLGMALLFTLEFFALWYYYFWRQGSNFRWLKASAVSLNILFLAAAVLGAILLFASPAKAVEVAGAAGSAAGDLGESIRQGLAYVGMGIATGCAAIGAGIGAGIAGAAGIGAVSEKPQMLARTLIYVGLAEGAAIYGLLISFIIMTKI